MGVGEETHKKETNEVAVGETTDVRWWRILPPPHPREYPEGNRWGLLPFSHLEMGPTFSPSSSLLRFLLFACGGDVPPCHWCLMAVRWMNPRHSPLARAKTWDSGRSTSVFCRCRKKKSK